MQKRKQKGSSKSREDLGVGVQFYLVKANRVSEEHE